MSLGSTAKPNHYQAITEGRLEDLPDLPPRTLKIYLCSNYSDFELERSVLQRDVIPDIQKHCVKYGLDVVWYDVHHGSDIDHAMDTHAFNLHLDTIHECCRESAGTFFVCLVGSNYGECPLPLTIDECEFRHIRNEAFEAGKDIKLLDEWYVKDDNSIPPTYILRAISEKFRDFYTRPSRYNGDHRLDLEAWSYIYSVLLDMIQYGAHVAHVEGHINQVHHHKQQKFFTSALDQEIQHAFKITSDRCIFVFRNIEDVEEQIDEPSKTKNKKRNKENTTKLQRLKQLKQLIETRVKATNIFTFTLSRTGATMRKESEDYFHYLENLTAAIATKIREHVDLHQKRNLTFPPSDLGKITLESLIHLQHCKSLFNRFNGFGLEKVLSNVQMLLLNETKSEHYAIVVKGPIYSGKTMFVSKVCYRAKELFGKDTVLITRFIGLTPQSLDVKEVLREICVQFNCLLQQHIAIKNYDFDSLVSYFHGLLYRVARGSRHILLVLDGVDRFETLLQGDCNNLLDWFGAKLSPKFHMILTFRTGTNCERVIQRLEKKSSFIKGVINLPEWSAERYKIVLKQMMSIQRKKIPNDQENAALKVLQGQDGSGILLDQIFCYLNTWRSSHIICCSVLPSSTAEAVHQVLDKMEQTTGREIIESISLYITLSQYGLSEMEILDLLSCNNSIMQVDLENVPTWIRFPCYVWLNLKYGFGNLLSTRYLQGKHLLWWSSAAVEDIIKSRYHKSNYCCDIQRDVAHVFSETWLHGKPIETRDDSRQVSQDINRLVCPQPLLYSETRYNLRRIHELWLQLLQAGDIESCKTNTLCNFEYLLALTHSSSIHVLLRNFKQTMTNFLDSEIFLIHNSLETSRNLLTLHPTQLANEIIGHLRQLQRHFPNFIESLVCQCMQWCDNYQHPIFVPLTSWFPNPHVSHVTSMENLDGGSIIAPLPNNHHMVTSFGVLDIAVYHVPSKKMLKMFSGHHGTVRCMCVSSNGQFLVSGSDDSTIRVWIISAGLCTNIIRNHSRAVLCVVLSHHDDIVFSGSEDTDIIISNVTTGKRYQVLKGHKKSVTSLKLNSTGTMLASASRDAKIIVWCLNDMSQLLCIYDGLHTPILCMDLSKDNTFLLAGCEDSSLNVISFTTGSWIHHLKRHKGWVNQVVITEDCYHAIAGCQDSAVYLYNLRTTELLEVYQGHSAPVTDLALSKDQTLIFSASEGKVNVWSLLRKSTTNTPKDDHTAPVTCLALGSENKVALTESTTKEGSHDEARQRRDTPSRKIMMIMGSNVLSMERGSENGEVKVWNLAQNAFLENFPGHSSYITCIEASTDGAFCVTASRDLSVKVWSMSLACVITNYECHNEAVEDVKILEDQLRICSRDRTGHFRLWRADDGETLVFYTLPATDFILSSDNQFLIATKKNNYARVWRTETGILVTSITHAESITCLACDPQDNYLVTGSADKSCKVWELRTGKLTQVLVEHDSEITQVVVSDDSETIVSGAEDGVVIVWTFSKGEAKYKLTGHVGKITQLKLLSNRNYVISASRDGTIRLWDISIGRLVTLIDMRVPVVKFVMTDDGSRVVVQLARSTHVPILCLHNCPSLMDGLDDISTRFSLECDEVLPLQPRNLMDHRASFEYPIPRNLSKKRKESDSLAPEIVKLSPIRAPPKPERKIRRPQIKVNINKFRNRKSTNDSKPSSVCTML